jgi:trk system potassium uptake protein TrkH
MKNGKTTIRRRGIIRQPSSFRITIMVFLAVILTGAALLALPAASAERRWTDPGDALFTATSAVCVTGLVVRDTGTYWSAFGQAVILILIQTGGLGIVTVAAAIATASGKRISLLQRNVLQESMSAYRTGGIPGLISLAVRVALTAEAAGALIMMPSFCGAFGPQGIWMAVFHSVSAFCNAGFDIMGGRTGEFSSLAFFADRPWVIGPVCLLIVVGGIGFLTWDDIAGNGLRFRRYRMQTKVILAAAAVLIAVPALLFFIFDFAEYDLKKRICLSLFAAVTPRTAGFSTADPAAMSGAGRAVTVTLMLIGGAPGSTAGGMKTTTAAVLLANAAAVVRRRKSAQLFGRRIDDQTVRSASTLLMIYLLLAVSGACAISLAEGAPFGACLFETSSAIGTVGLTTGITPSLGAVSRAVLMILMFLGRVGGLTLMFAAVNSSGSEVAQRPVEMISVG